MATKVVFHTFPSMGSTVVSKTPTHSYSSSSFCDPTKLSGSPSFSPKIQFLKFSKQNKTSFLGSGVSRRRYCSADQNQFNLFIPIDYGSWFHNPKIAFIIMLVGFGVVISFYFGSIGVVPYNKRKQFSIMFKDLDRLFDCYSKEILEGLEWKILPAEHPDSVRVRLIGNDIIAALQLRLRHEQDALLGDSTLKIVRDWQKATNHHLDGFNWEFFVVDKPDVVNAVYIPGGKILVNSGALNKLQTDAEIATIIGHEVGHAVALHCHIKVWDALWYKIIQIVLCLLFMPYIVKSIIGIVGTFAISALLLSRPLTQKMESEEDDTELMDMALDLLCIIIPIAIYLFFMPHTVKAAIHIVGACAMYSLLLSLPLSRKMEMEADYIGLILMASAGYDPCVAPNVFEKVGEAILLEQALDIIGTDHPSNNNEEFKLVVKLLMASALDIIGTHPSAKKRVEMLTEAMEEALSLYRQTLGVEIFH